VPREQIADDAAQQAHKEGFDAEKKDVHANIYSLRQRVLAHYREYSKKPMPASSGTDTDSRPPRGAAERGTDDDTSGVTSPLEIRRQAVRR